MAFRQPRDEEGSEQQGQGSGEIVGNRAMRRMQRKEETRRPTTPERRRPTPPPQRERTGPREFSREVRAELRKVAWPSRPEVVNSTIIVLLAVTFLTAMIFGYDFAFGKFVLYLYD